VIGGLITSTLLTSLVLPAIYPWFAPRQRANLATD
jgi:cobalt-zinc-cadmium resistance protein CzcA